jgi:hypothetical protein
MAYISRATKKMSGNLVDFAISIDGLIDAIAAGHAVTESMTDSKYLDALVDVAFEVADDEFNLEAEAYAKSTGKISHMYEWGTNGINKGRTNVRMPASNPNARLWHNFTVGTGLDRTLTFAFRPSLANVPKPTQQDTGMSQEVINKLRDHTFKWKAEVLEDGQEVTIAPKRVKFILIPAYKDERYWMRPSDVKRGYALFKYPIRSTPGEGKYYGAFEAFWYAYWLDHGDALIESGVTEMVIEDYQPEFRPKRTVKTLRPVGTISVRTEVAKKSTKIQAKVTKKARARKAAKQ